jgi:REP element-mobilizing transposase RayT
MHLVLRSSRAKGDWSFWKPRNRKAINRIIDKFSRKYGVKVHSMANVGNHLHFQIKLSSRYGYKPFIRAVTGAISMAITGASRWNSVGAKPNLKSEKRIRATTKRSGPSLRFWDYRPFTRVVLGLRAYLKLKDYIEINRLEGEGFQRPQARFFIAWDRAKAFDSG